MTCFHCIFVWMVYCGCWRPIDAFKTLSSPPPPPSPPNNTAITSSFCHSELMNLTCPPPLLLLLSQARYGRMSISKCVKEKFGGYLGCWNDVTSILDARCSGRKECSVKILEENFNHMRPCHEDLKSYLELTYSCVAVLQKKDCADPKHLELSKQQRHHHHHHLLTSSSSASFFHHTKSPTFISTGYISSSVSLDLNCGVPGNPWTLTSHPDQNINVTLFDLASPGQGRLFVSNAVRSGASNDQKQDSLPCLIFATVRDTVSNHVVNICAVLGGLYGDGETNGEGSRESVVSMGNDDNQIINAEEEEADGSRRKSDGSSNSSNNIGEGISDKSRLNQNVQVESATGAFDAALNHSSSAKPVIPQPISPIQSVSSSLTSSHAHSLHHPFALSKDFPPFHPPSMVFSETIRSKAMPKRQQHITTSSSNQLEITIFQNSKIFDHLFFLRFEAIGCRNVSTAGGLWSKRNKSHMILGCANGGEEWLMRCEKGEWVGEKRNCTNAEKMIFDLGKSWKTYLLLPLEMSLAIILSLASIIGVSVLFVGIYCMKRSEYPLTCPLADHSPRKGHLFRHKVSSCSPACFNLEPSGNAKENKINNKNVENGANINNSNNINNTTHSSVGNDGFCYKSNSNLVDNKSPKTFLFNPYNHPDYLFPTISLYNTNNDVNNSSNNCNNNNSIIVNNNNNQYNDRIVVSDTTGSNNLPLNYVVASNNTFTKNNICLPPLFNDCLSYNCEHNNINKNILCTNNCHNNYHNNNNNCNDSCSHNVCDVAELSYAFASEKMEINKAEELSMSRSNEISIRKGNFELKESENSSRVSQSTHPFPLAPLHTPRTLSPQNQTCHCPLNNPPCMHQVHDCCCSSDSQCCPEQLLTERKNLVYGSSIYKDPHLPSAQIGMVSLKTSSKASSKDFLKSLFERKKDGACQGHSSKREFGSLERKNENNEQTYKGISKQTSSHTSKQTGFKGFFGPSKPSQITKEKISETTQCIRNGKISSRARNSHAVDMNDGVNDKKANIGKGKNEYDRKRKEEKNEKKETCASESQNKKNSNGNNEKVNSPETQIDFAGSGQGKNKFSTYNTTKRKCTPLSSTTSHSSTTTITTTTATTLATAVNKEKVTFLRLDPFLYLKEKY